MKKKKISTSILSSSTTNLALFKMNIYNNLEHSLVKNINNNKNNNNKNSIDSHRLNSHAMSLLKSILVILLSVEFVSKPSLVLANSLHSQSLSNTNNKLAPLYWVTNNRRFYESNSENYYLKLNAHIGDSIDLVCPKFQKNINDSSIDQTEANQAHYLTIYKVGSRYEFDNCIINPNNIETVPILKCDKPIINTKFTIYFVKYSPVPFALEFEEDKEYYFLSTSSGNKDGLNFMTGGLCSKFNMRFSIKINSADQQQQSPLQPQINISSSIKKHDQPNSASTSQLLSEEDGVILQQLKERIQSTVSSMNLMYNRNENNRLNETPPPQAQQSSKTSNLVFISNSNYLLPNHFIIYFLLVIFSLIFCLFY